MRRTLARLRWQLTLSHLIAIAFTLISMIAAVAVIATSWWWSTNPPARAPAQEARLVGTMVGRMVQDGTPAELGVVLRALVQGQLRVAAQLGPSSARGPAGADLSLHNLAYIAVVGADGRLVASSDPSNAAFAPPEQQEWQALVAPALDGAQNDLVLTRSGSGPAALGAAPILDEAGRPVAVVLVGVSSLPQVAGGPFWPLAALGLATLAILAAAFVFAVASSSLVAYLLSRRLVARLEHLGRAAEALRAGNLAARVAVSGNDEVAHLQESFNNMAAELETERDRVVGLLAARRQLVAGVSHELRTPVATLRGYLEAALQRNGVVPSELRGDLETMEREVGRLQRLIDDLFTLSRAEVGRLSVRAEPTNVSVVVQHLVDTQAPLAWHQRRVQLLAEPGQDVPAARADAERLEQIVSNLVNNAIRHTPPGGLVAAVVAAEPDRVRIEVRDTGEGIPADELPLVFERFYRGNGSDGRAGAGLGLA
ncbi:MAG: HAMP domain-containing histidine kinase, partial [Chloroflexota bacterium]|nr:HAMP domain-containing histidine kinase [Chloroflexota bacterium]